MHIYANLLILGVIGISLLAFSSFHVVNPRVSFLLTVFSYTVFLIITFFNTRFWLEREHDRRITCLKEKYEQRIKRLKNERDTITLEKTIRNGTKTLIKNAVDYFKIENIKNEMPPSAAIQNLQLDKYGQIIELLADFSLILPDYEENRKIVQQEIIHQIDIYHIDEKPFADFLQTIMGKYMLTVNKKYREKIQLKNSRTTKTCPSCFRRVSLNASECIPCGFIFDNMQNSVDLRKQSATDWIRRGYEFYRSGNMKEAVSVLTNAIDLNPKSVEAYYSRGVIFEKMNKHQKAMDDLEIAARLGHEKAKNALSRIKMSQTQEWRTSALEQ